MEVLTYWHEDTFKSYFLRSLTGHVLILLLSIVFGKILNLPIPFLNNPANIAIVESVVRVDLVSMPKMTLKELKAVDMSEVQFSKENVEAKVAVEKVQEGEEKEQENPDSPTFNQEKKKNFEDLIKKWGKKKTKQNTAEVSSTLDSKLKGKFAQLVAEGNKISKGSALVGQTEGEASEFVMYLSTLPDMVRPYWRLPSYLKNQGYRCRIRIFLANNGDLIKADIYESSGSSEYDQRSLEAVKRSAPFPSPPSAVVARATKGEIVLGFPL